MSHRRFADWCMLHPFHSRDWSHIIPLCTQEVGSSQGAFRSVVSTRHVHCATNMNMKVACSLRQLLLHPLSEYKRCKMPRMPAGYHPASRAWDQALSGHWDTRLCRQIRSLLSTYTQPLMTPLYWLELPLSCASFVF